MVQATGVFGTLQLSGPETEPICYVHLAAIPPVGTLIGVHGPTPSYYRVLQTMLIVKPIHDLTLAALMERAEADGESPDLLSNQCVVFVEPA